MNDIVIKAENLGKKYIIGHQAENGSYVALRDVLMHNARTFWNKTKDMVKGKAVIQGDTMEEVWALKDINFEIKRGEAVGIIGRNGAGKSTLLKVLSRITEPSTGRVTIRGRVASLLEVGTGFHPELTGRENIYLNGTILGMTRAEIKKKFDEIVAFAEIEKFLDTPVKRYSSGMYMRLAFAVAAHLEPEILVVDEVLAVGDAAFQKKCLGKMEDVTHEGRTVLFVSHNMGAIRNLCKSVIILDQGVAVYNGSVNKGMDIYNSMSKNISNIKVKKEIFNQSMEIKNYSFYSTQNKELINGESIPLGERLRILIEFITNETVRGASFSIDILNVSGELISHLINEDGALSFPSLKKGTIKTIEITTAPICFTPGLYIVNLWTGIGHSGDQCCRIKNAFSFVIEQSDFVKRTTPLPKHAKVFLASDWNIIR